MYFGLHNVNANKEKRKVETALRFAWGGSAIDLRFLNFENNQMTIGVYLPRSPTPIGGSEYRPRLIGG